MPAWCRPWQGRDSPPKPGRSPSAPAEATVPSATASRAPVFSPANFEPVSPRAAPAPRLTPATPPVSSARRPNRAVAGLGGSVRLVAMIVLAVLVMIVFAVIALVLLIGTRVVLHQNGEHRTRTVVEAQGHSHFVPGHEGSRHLHQHDVVAAGHELE